MRITAELTEIPTSRIIWARAYDSSLDLSFDEQDRIVSQIVHTLSPRIVETELLRIRGKRTENMSIYECPSERSASHLNHLSQGA